ncbi:MAG: hypothetical protein C0594_01510 [Marinilabiliales bacterium]|nr:MAG: hypothetical protein C0594_01510 [Marinilabiliales bacterium]
MGNGLLMAQSHVKKEGFRKTEDKKRIERVSIQKVVKVDSDSILVEKQECKFKVYRKDFVPKENKDERRKPEVNAINIKLSKVESNE